MTTNKNKSTNRYKAAGLVILILLIIAVLVMLLRGCGETQAVTDSVSAGLSYDSAAVEGGWEELSTDEIVASLNEKVEEGMINISMNTAPVFETGTAAGNLMIVNEAVNRYPQVVEIVRNDTGKTIYTSGGIPVGSKVEAAALDVALPAGTYECTALFHNADLDTGEYLGTAGAIITVTVQG